MTVFTIETDKQTFNNCTEIIVVPVHAVKDPGNIQLLGTHSNAHAKHIYYSISQTLYYQFQDGEIHPLMTSKCRIFENEKTIHDKTGLVLFRLANGEMGLINHGDISIKTLLEATYRFCSKWIRFDI